MDALAVRRLLLSFKDLSSTPIDDTINNLLGATKSLQALVIYLCEKSKCNLASALEREF